MLFFALNFSLIHPETLVNCQSYSLARALQHVVKRRADPLMGKQTGQGAESPLRLSGGGGSSEKRHRRPCVGTCEDTQASAKAQAAGGIS